jgi:hypothetical protein
MRFRHITFLFSIAPLSDVQLENGGVMLLKSYSESCVITNPCFVHRSWVGLGLILSYRYIYRVVVYRNVF